MTATARLAVFLAVQLVGLLASGCLTGYVVSLGTYSNHLAPDRIAYNGAACPDGAVVIDTVFVQDARPHIWWDVADRGDDHYGFASGGRMYRRFVVVPPACFSRPPDRVVHEGGRDLECREGDGGSDVAVYELMVGDAGDGAAMFPFHVRPLDAVVADLPPGIAQELPWSGDRIEGGSPHFRNDAGAVTPIRYLPDGQSQSVMIRLQLPPDMQTERRWWFWPSKVLLPPALLVDSILLFLYGMGSGG